MTTISAIDQGPCDGLVHALRAEFGAVLAARIMEAEVLDFLWEARVAERYCGQHFGQSFELGDDGETELSRVAIVSFLDGSWHAALCVADGEAAAVALLWQHRCQARDEAQAVFDRAV
jgi:hypothetical protein